MVECDIMKNNKGQALVEFIIVLPILLLLIMCIIDLGNIVVKKYSIENDMDVIYDMYRSNNNTEINNYVKEKELEINYEKDGEFVIINLSKITKINTPILNNILGHDYKIEVSKTIYE